MAEEAPELSLKQQLLLIVGTIMGGAINWAIITQLPIAQASIISSILLAGLFLVCATTSSRLWWWSTVGAIAGIIMGWGWVMAGYVAEESEPLEQNLRLVFVVCQCLAGLLVGIIAARRQQNTELPTLTGLLARLSGVTASLW
jgi:hydrogenase/urease accessory protein HupE